MWMVIGASGFLGAYMIKSIRKVSEEPVLAVARNIPAEETGGVSWLSADVTDDAGVSALGEASRRGERNRVVYLAAYHNPDLVQANPRYAWDVNVTALSRVLNVLENVDSFFYSSTDSVYGESENGYHFREDDACSPKNRYGVQKRTAEALVTGYGHHVARFPFLIGRSLAANKKHFFDRILDSLARGEPVGMFCDSFRSALDFGTAGRCLTEIMRHHARDCPPVINIAGDGDLSKYDIGLMIAQKYGFPEDRIVPVSIRESGEIFKTPRATSTLLDNSLLKRLLHVESVTLDLS